MKRKILYSILAVITLIIYFSVRILDRPAAYYGNSLFRHDVLPFQMHIIKGWSHEHHCDLYNFGYHGQTYGTYPPEHYQYVTIDDANPHTPSQQICMITMLSYGYNKNEMIVHWLSCDSTEYYVKLDSANHNSFHLYPSQFLTTDEIIKDNYTWITLIPKDKFGTIPL